MSDFIEVIEANGQVLCYLIREGLHPEKSLFITPPEARQQVGFIVYSAGSQINRHSHRNLERRLVGMSEVLVVKKGICELDLYDDAQNPVTTRRLKTGDAVILVGGGHGFRVIKDTVLLEIKQGPYLGEDDKELF